MQVSRYWFRDPSSHVAGGPFRRTATLCLEVFPSTPSRRTLKVPGRSIHGVAPPSEYDRRGRPRFLHGMPRDASHEVSGSSSTYQLSSPLIPGLPHPVRSVPRVFHPLDGFLLDSLPGLVSCRERSWSSKPFRAFPSSGAVVPLDTPCLPAIHRDAFRRPTFPSGLQIPVRGDRSAGCFWCGFKALLPGASPLRSPLSVGSAECSMLSWVSGPFRVVPSRPRAGMLPPGSSHEL